STAVPRLLTRMSASGACAKKASAPSAVERSAAMPEMSTSGKASRICRTASSTRAFPRPLTTTEAPARASPSAVARPMPAVDPVTIAVRPLSSIFMSFISNCGADDSLSGLHEPIGEAIGLALDRGIEHLDRVRIVLVREQGAFRVQYEAGGLHLLANGCRLNPMQRLGVAHARPDGGGVVYDDVGPTGLQP